MELLSLCKSSKYKLIEAEAKLHELLDNSTDHTKILSISSISPLKVTEDNAESVPMPAVNLVEEVEKLERKRSRKEKREKKEKKKEKQADENKEEPINSTWSVEVDNYKPVSYTAKSVLADLNADIDLLAL